MQMIKTVYDMYITCKGSRLYTICTKHANDKNCTQCVHMQIIKTVYNVYWKCKLSRLYKICTTHANNQDFKRPLKKKMMDLESNWKVCFLHSQKLT